MEGRDSVAAGMGGGEGEKGGGGHFKLGLPTKEENGAKVDNQHNERCTHTHSDVGDGGGGGGGLCVQVG